MEQRAVSVEVTPNGYVVSCPGTEVVGRGPTETDAWLDFWDAVRDDWKPPGESSVAPLGGRLPARRARRVRTIRVRDLFG
ncbi:hypothetical protein ACFU5O_20255 [Streptomyces sp. NPDC057445]|uniref:hypothetical protein n=1 Tax=Streptomyces sp. NPDC057445 TaxID=3346136 RepID=UPI0036AF9CCC